MNSSARIRTGDLGLMNPALYQLSYAADGLQCSSDGLIGKGPWCGVPGSGKVSGVPTRKFAMATESNESVQATADRKVRDDLLEKLHQANQRFHDAKKQLEAVMDDSEYSHQQRIDHAEDELRLAEREVEQVTLEIHGTLKPPVR